MKKVRTPDNVINPQMIKPGSRIYVSGNAATPQLRQPNNKRRLLGHMQTRIRTTFTPDQKRMEAIEILSMGAVPMCSLELFINLDDDRD